jgi:hypothetical protein
MFIFIFVFSADLTIKMDVETQCKDGLLEGLSSQVTHRSRMDISFNKGVQNLQIRRFHRPHYPHAGQTV